jgi:small subunit ribosomal protein S6
LTYETIFIVNPELDESEIKTVIEGVKTAIESGGGKILKLDPWGKKKLAYSINRHNDGYYVLIVFESSPGFVSQLNNYYLITEPIIKHIVIRFEGDLSAPARRTAEGLARGSAADLSDGNPSKDIESEDDDEDDEDKDES